MSENRRQLIEELSKTPKKYPYKLISDEEILILYDSVVRLGAKVILDFGTGLGHGTMGLVFGAKETGGHVYSCDIGEGGDGISKTVPKKFEGLGLSSLVTFTIEDDLEFLKKWGDKQIDFLYIDTSHTYKQTKEEVGLAVPLLSENGECFIHDVLHATHYIDENAAILGFIQSQFINRTNLYGYEIIPVSFNAAGGLGRIYRYKI